MDGKEVVALIVSTVFVLVGMAAVNGLVKNFTGSGELNKGEDAVKDLKNRLNQVCTGYRDEGSVRLGIPDGKTIEVKEKNILVLNSLKGGKEVEVFEQEVPGCNKIKLDVRISTSTTYKITRTAKKEVKVSYVTAESTSDGSGDGSGSDGGSGGSGESSGQSGSAGGNTGDGSGGSSDDGSGSSGDTGGDSGGSSTGCGSNDITIIKCDSRLDLRIQLPSNADMCIWDDDQYKNKEYAGSDGFDDNDQKGEMQSGGDTNSDGNSNEYGYNNYNTIMKSGQEIYFRCYRDGKVKYSDRTKLK
ncbi:MAG: hypothetical protein ABEJ56_06805 [Candidatus Nanohaloarchaea archaeon]